MEREHLLPAVFVTVAFIILLVFASGVFAAPRAGSQEECAAIADMGVTARALAEEKLSVGATMSVMGRMYHPALMAKWGESIVKAAHRDQRAAKDFAGALANSCMERQGVMDSFLGTSL